VLYGFTEPAALGLFGMLTGVSGVGPRTALALLSTLDPSRLQTAIVTGDTAALSAAQGVGARTASRIILDLKGKLDDAEFADVGFSGDVDGQVIAALTALGYSTAEARAAAAVPAVAEETEVDDRIRVALQQFATRG
ncbi:MAG: Holliday junction branch migration protein RuvA, partial [Chloroflexi bacterium]|nr:Holliday junction branch migration protein RuvA [Chloroflexota bacterium]